jgi:hypothetical protein
MLNWVKREQELTKCRRLSVVKKPRVVAVYLNGLNDLKTSMRICRMIQDAGGLQRLEMQTQSQMTVKWSDEFVD